MQVKLPHVHHGYPWAVHQHGLRDDERGTYQQVPPSGSVRSTPIARGHRHMAGLSRLPRTPPPPLLLRLLHMIPARRHLIAGGLLLTGVIVASACAAVSGSSTDVSGSSTDRTTTPTSRSTPTPTQTSGPTSSKTNTPDPVARIHNAAPSYIPLFVRITFTSSTTYEQAVSILESGPSARAPYPWNCDEPRSPTPPPLPDRQAAYDASHSLLLSYAVWDELVWLASSSQVVSVDGTYVYPCP